MKYQYDALSKGAPFMANPSEYPGPYFGPELIIDPYFSNPANWHAGASWSVIVGQACHDATTNSYLIKFM